MKKELLTVKELETANEREVDPGGYGKEGVSVRLVLCLLVVASGYI
jgi:hypothetical protein